jgi:hypothetical protein
MAAIPKSRPGGIVHFGKRKARRSDRNLMFATLLKAPLALPVEYDLDVAHRGVPTSLRKTTPEPAKRPAAGTGGRHA